MSPQTLIHCTAAFTNNHPTLGVYAILSKTGMADTFFYRPSVACCIKHLPTFWVVKLLQNVQQLLLADLVGR